MILSATSLTSWTTSFQIYGGARWTTFPTDETKSILAVQRLAVTVDRFRHVGSRPARTARERVYTAFCNNPAEFLTDAPPVWDLDRPVRADCATVNRTL